MDFQPLDFFLFPPTKNLASVQNSFLPSKEYFHHAKFVTVQFNQIYFFNIVPECTTQHHRQMNLFPPKRLQLNSNFGQKKLLFLDITTPRESSMPNARVNITTTITALETTGGGAQASLRWKVYTGRTIRMLVPTTRWKHNTQRANWNNRSISLKQPS